MKKLTPESRLAGGFAVALLLLLLESALSAGPLLRWP